MATTAPVKREGECPRDVPIEAPAKPEKEPVKVTTARRRRYARVASVSRRA